MPGAERQYVNELGRSPMCRLGVLLHLNLGAFVVLHRDNDWDSKLIIREVGFTYCEFQHLGAESILKIILDALQREAVYLSHLGK